MSEHRPDESAQRERPATQDGGVRRRGVLLGSTSLLAASALASTSLPRIAGAATTDSVLPRPQPPFAGKIGRTAKDSTPDFPKGVEAPKGAPECPARS